MIWKETPLSDCEVQSIVCFSTIENNSGAKTRRCLWTVDGEENVMNLKNIQWSVFWGGRTNIDDEHKEWLSRMLDEIVWCVCSLLKDDCRLTITDMQREIAAHFSHEAGKATIVCTLQQLVIWKVCAGWASQQLMEEHWKNQTGAALNFPAQYKEDGNDLPQWIITSDGSRIHFYTPQRKSKSVV